MIKYFYSSRRRRIKEKFVESTIDISNICCYNTYFKFQTEKDTRSDSSDETLSSTDESINANTPSKKNNLTKQKSSKATTGNSVQSNEDHHLQNNHEKIQ